MSRWTSAVAVALFLFLVLGGAQLVGAFEPFERKTLDLRMKLLREPRAFRDDIVFVMVGQYSLNWFWKQEGIGWPWRRDLWPYLIDYITKGGAKLILFDIGFTEGREFDQELGKSIRESGRVLQSTLFTDDPEEHTNPPVEFVEHSSIPVQGSISVPEAKAIVAPIEPVWRGARRCVSARVYPDSDGAHRRYPLLVRVGDQHYPSAALAMAAEVEGTWTIRAEPGALVLGTRRIPVDEQGGMLMFYDRVDEEVTKYEAASVITSAALEGEKAPVIPASAFKDKIVIVGALAPGLFDVKVTPIDEAEPGVMIHATALSNILDERYLRRPPAWVLLGVLGVVVTGVCLATRVFSARWGAVTAVGATLLYVGITGMAFRGRLWLDVVSPTLGMTVAYAATSALNYVTEGRQRRRVKRMFQQYVSAGVVEKILKRSDALAAEGERKELTILFLDFQGFTDMSERLEPVELVKLMNAYHNEAVEEIFRYEGTLDKFIGDAIMAFWNDPLLQKDHARRACLAAVAIRERLRTFARAMHERGMPHMRARVGINTGVAVAGNMGSHLQYNYTVMGDTVNLASRLEGANKEFGTDVLASEAAVVGARDVLELRELGQITVIGKHEPVRIYEILGRRGEVPAEVVASARRFEEGLAHFRARRWTEAKACFTGGDGASRSYAALCDRYEAEPPPAGWEGVYVLEHK